MKQKIIKQDTRGFRAKRDGMDVNFYLASDGKYFEIYYLSINGEVNFINDNILGRYGDLKSAEKEFFKLKESLKGHTIQIV